MSSDQFPSGWDEQRVRRVLDHYGSQTEDEAADEDERVLEDTGHTVMDVPRELVPAVRELIARHQARTA